MRTLESIDLRNKRALVRVVHPGENANNADFAAELAALGDVYINDAFAACHRKHASVYGLPRHFMPGLRGVGLLVDREIEALGHVVDSPPRPFVAIFGGAKVSDKLCTASLEGGLSHGSSAGSRFPASATD